MKELKDTITMMTSDDYKTKFMAEYWQTKIRYEKLKTFCTKIEAEDVMKFSGVPVEHIKHDCPLDMLRKQQLLMGQLLHVYELRAIIENIDLTNVPKVEA